MNTMTKKFYELALRSPGLKESVKVDFRLSKKDLLFLARLIDNGLSTEIKKDDDILQLLPAETKEELKQVQAEILKKGDLTEFYTELNQL